jgi:hypothetical protein
MKAFGNHFRVQDRRTDHLLTYDSGVASVFDMPSENAKEVSINCENSKRHSEARLWSTSDTSYTYELRVAEKSR